MISKKVIEVNEIENISQEKFSLFFKKKKTLFSMFPGMQHETFERGYSVEEGEDVFVSEEIAQLDPFKWETSLLKKPSKSCSSILLLLTIQLKCMHQ